MKITPALNGFIKGLGIVMVTAGVAYLGDVANWIPLVGNSLAFLSAGIFSMLESHIRDHTGKGLMGAVSIY